MKDDILNDLKESQEALRRLLQSPAISTNEANREYADRLKQGLNRISTNIQNYNELDRLDKLVDNISNNLRKE